MASAVQLKPTLHVEVLATKAANNTATAVPTRAIGDEVRQWLSASYVTVKVGQDISGYKGLKHGKLIDSVDIVDFTGPDNVTGYHKLSDAKLDLQAYVLHSDDDDGTGTIRRQIKQHQDDDDQLPQARVIELPSKALNGAWDSLVFDDSLPSRLLRYMTRMISMMKQPGLRLTTFNWNRICLLHGPAGSGKSTLCRALAQKLSIRLSGQFKSACLVEINTNALLSKYFSESGKLIGAAFERIRNMAQDKTKLVCVLMDEVETIAGSRERSSAGGECNDGMRATNQLLTALDRLRNLPNILVMCTSNLIAAIDPAFLDRVDIKQLIPSPSPAAIYNIFRSCLNELVRSSLIDTAQTTEPEPTESTPEQWELTDITPIPTFAEMKVKLLNQPQSPGRRLWATAQRCEGLSGRTLRRLPILGLAMYTWGGDCTMQDAISALEAAVEQELEAKI